MFLRAGHTRFCVVCRAFIGRWGWRGGARASTLVRFVPSGEYAWAGGGGATWPENVAMIASWREAVPADLAEGRIQRESSRLPE